jgi:hypothetical protein
MNDALEIRASALERLEKDLVGPQSADEVLAPPDPWRRIYPSDVYLTGILFPRGTAAGPEDDDHLATEGGGEGESDTAADEAPATNALRPSVAGCSFAAAAENGRPTVVFSVSCGTYRSDEVVCSAMQRRRLPQDLAGQQPATGAPGNEDDSTSSATPSGKDDSAEDEGRSVTVWSRQDHAFKLPPLSLDFPHKTVPLDEYGVEGLALHVRVAPWVDGCLVTATLVNQNEFRKDDDRIVGEEKSFFQVRLEVTPQAGTRLPARPSWRPATDHDGRMAELLYRDAKEFAVGHTCSAEWEADIAGYNARYIATTWVPRTVVPNTSTKGAAVFSPLLSHPKLKPFSASWLAAAQGEELRDALALLPKAYGEWIDQQSGRVEELPERLRSQAAKHLHECRAVAKRMSAAIDLLAEDRVASTAFRLGNQAMLIQRKWANPQEQDLQWRPFQLGFILLTIPSVTGKDMEDRQVMDLLWFPTGGGKTEAYLGLVAFILFYRRLSSREQPDAGAGVAALMRYTLRLLTTQQFQRAAALICACEVLRSGSLLPSKLRDALGKKPFSLGLWVGQDAVPNKVKDAILALQQNAPNTPAQLERCPACRKKLRWYPDATQSSLLVTCDNNDCEIGQTLGTLPVWTVDEDIYRQSPSLVIGTVDKFAQIVRNTNSASLFGLRTRYRAPDLIIQDELHLISGPLGTMTGVYEVAIDELCTRNRIRPKIIGSTATIRRAEEQIRALFDRDTRQFPPPGIDARDSCFALQDDGPDGRLYVGVTTAGRSAKFALQAVSASLLQASEPLSPPEVRDAYWTLVVYFNALRELGGAWVLTQDDVPATIGDYAGRRGESPRKVQIVEEMTSRVTQLRIREMLDELKLTAVDAGVIDVLLASNMISVGVDIPRLGLMVVNGQPKTIAEYIQATSRVGRGRVPGLVVGVYNNNKSRDRSHFESFRTWHSTLYREVEATSVTPFASRARDRALHAVLVALLRHMVPGMLDSPQMSPAAEGEAKRFVDSILERVQRVDDDELQGTRKQLLELIDEWKHRSNLKSYWNDRYLKTSLLVSAERAAALRATGRLPGAAWPTPNSMRSVEPGTPFVLVERLRSDITPAAGVSASEANNAE